VTLMAQAAARLLRLNPSRPLAFPPAYGAALSASLQHVKHTRRQATAWRLAAAASMTLCLALAGTLSLPLTRPAMVLHVIQSSNASLADPAPTQREATSSIRSVNLLHTVHLAPPASPEPDLRAFGERTVSCSLRPMRHWPVGWWQFGKL
jgi:hypothetical protein